MGTLTARLVLGDISFEPEAARTINGGLLTFSQDEVDELSRLNYAAARRAFLKQAQGRTLVDAAKSRAVENVRGYLGLALRAAGRGEVRVVATFDP